MSDKKFKILFPTDGYVLKNYNILKDILKSVSEYVKFKATIKIDRFFNDCYVITFSTEIFNNFSIQLPYFLLNDKKNCIESILNAMKYQVINNFFVEG